MDTFEANGARFIAADDMIVKWCRKNRREFEPETTAFIFAVLKEHGGAFVDVGASTGWFSIPAALRGADVVSVECNPRVFARLGENIGLNEGAGERIVSYCAAASRRSGEATFFSNPALPLTSGGSIQAATCAGPIRETVTTVTLDSLSLAGVSLMKIDVEGHELAALDGAAELIKESRPALVLEANTRSHREQLEHWLTLNGYDWEAADQRNMLCRPLPL